MVGFYARANSTHTIRVDLDNELADARWFTREEVLAVLNHNTSVQTEKDLVDEPPFKMPPATAIAGVLIRDWAEGRVKFDRIPSSANL
jgi:NAD+ diphosphatase